MKTVQTESQKSDDNRQKSTRQQSHNKADSSIGTQESEMKNKENLSTKKSQKVEQKVKENKETVEDDNVIFKCPKRHLNKITDKLFERFIKGNDINESSINIADLSDPYTNGAKNLEKIKLQKDNLRCMESLEEPATKKINIEDVIYDETKDILGKGSFGIVYKARYQGTFVALKKISRKETSDKDIIREVEVLSGTQHDNTIHIF